MGFTRLTTESWKSVRVQNVSQTYDLSLRGSKEVKLRINSIGTGILEVC